MAAIFSQNGGHLQSKWRPSSDKMASIVSHKANTLSFSSVAVSKKHGN
jgi:hypothetical protein